VNSISRVTQTSIAANTIGNLQFSLSKLQRIQDELSSGKQLNKPSDNPSQTVNALSYRAEIRRTDQYTRNIQDGMDWLGQADSTLTSMLPQVQRARELVLQGSNSSMSIDERQANAPEIDTIKQGLISQANTSYLGHPIFAGTYSNPSGATVAYDANGVYQGDSGAVMRNAGPGQQVQVNVNGPQVFGTGATQLFNVLQQISDDLRSTNPSDTANLSQVDLGNLDTAMSTMQTTLSQVGARYNRLDTLKSQYDDRMIQLKGSLSNVEDVDLPKTITDLQLQQTAYQAALAASARMIQPSLVDFLR
jgi:flagellar hook-associated protein 3 FlgL